VQLGDGAKGVLLHRFGGNSDQSNNKAKINLLLIEINFFLGRIIKPNKIT
jgi:hypothetical protein